MVRSAWNEGNRSVGKMTGQEYEDLIASLVLRAGFFVKREPVITGKTPDIWVKGRDGGECIIECTTLSRSRDCRHGKHVFGFDDPNNLNARLYAKIEEKLRKYTEGIIGGLPLVIAVRNECCSFFDSSAMETALGAWRYGSDRWNNLWAGTDDAWGLFGKYSQCSGFLHSTWTDHLFIPILTLGPKQILLCFLFASVAEPVFHPSGVVKASSPKNPPEDAIVAKIRGVTVHGLPPGAMLVDGVFEVVGEEDGVPQVVFHGKMPFEHENCDLTKPGEGYRESPE